MATSEVHIVFEFHFNQRAGCHFLYIAHQIDLRHPDIILITPPQPAQLKMKYHWAWPLLVMMILIDPRKGIWLVPGVSQDSRNENRSMSQPVLSLVVRLNY